MTHTRQLVLGLFFVAVLGLLGYYTLFLTDFSLFSEKHELVVHFPEANGLREGDSVLVAGVRQGRVGALTLDPSADMDRRITVVLWMDVEVFLRDGHRIEIEDATLLGGRHVYIDPGPPDGSPIDVTGPLYGTVQANALAGLGELIDENSAGVSRIIENIDELVASVRSGEGLLGSIIADSQVRSDFTDGLSAVRKTFDNAEAITADVRAGKGALGRLISDEDLAQKVEEIGANLAEITTELRTIMADVGEGKGTLGRIVKDEAMSEDLAQSIANLRDITRKINEGEGTLGRLVVDGKIADQIEAVLGDVSEGKGTLGRLLSNDEIYENLARVADDLAAATSAIRNEKGTVGKLIMDDGLYEELERAVGLVTASLEEYREAAPVTTFTSILFGAF